VLCHMNFISVQHVIDNYRIPFAASKKIETH
jgi:hypothetical protein